MFLKIDPDLETRFPGLRVLIGRVKGVKVNSGKVELREFKGHLVERVKELYSLETLKDVPVFKAYRGFFWKVGIDPTKIRPAAEALTRRILGGKAIPSINNVVDAYNLASIETGIALAAFDEDSLKGDLLMRYSCEGESFQGIGMKKPMKLKGDEIVISDSEKLVAIYPYRDADQAKITHETRNVLLLVCGVPGIGEEALTNAGHIAIEYVTRFGGGEEELG
ncbi:MAG: hypothetical protein GTN80_07060 [Nitrososphaeria archaeon]|nr:hypothetical protein [Nitrososphaeria archaeon]NIQ33385.1 hypothetical protein [Nitrososphaeria archaeon]